MPVESNPRILVGRETSDDAGVYLLDEQTALVQTVDFFTPIVNDPYHFGRIAAANALSDIYAMGAEPLTALNIVCFPTKKLEISYLREILRGGFEKIHEAGAVLIGGHSVEDEEIKYGLSVTGIIHPAQVLTNKGAMPGDALVLTKPLGTGILATGLKGKLIAEEEMAEVVEWMASLNKTAAALMRRFSVHGCTDITGFGFLGHALEMAVASEVVMEVEVSAVPILPRVYELASYGIVPAGGYTNRTFCARRIVFDDKVDPIMLDILLDPQTSGGLLISLPPTDAHHFVSLSRAAGLSYAALVGRVVEKGEGRIRVVP